MTFGRKHRPSRHRKSGGHVEGLLEHPEHDLTVFKLSIGKLVLKRDDRGGRRLRIEVVVNNVEELRCRKRLEKLPPMLDQLERMVVDFLAAVWRPRASSSAKAAAASLVFQPTRPRT